MVRAVALCRREVEAGADGSAASIGRGVVFAPATAVAAGCGHAALDLGAQQLGNFPVLLSVGKER